MTEASIPHCRAHLQVGHVVLPLHRLQPSPEQPQSDGIVPHAGQQLGILIHKGVPTYRHKSLIALSFSMPGIKMCCDGYKRDGLHDDILPMEDSLSAKLVNDLVHPLINHILGFTA